MAAQTQSENEWLIGIITPTPALLEWCEVVWSRQME